MPATQTITTHNVFAAGTKARATEVNTNFDNFRGFLIPIDPSISTGQAVSDLSYGLGAAPHRWGESWIEKINFGRTTTGWQIADQTTSGNDISFSKNGAEVGRIQSLGTLTGFVLDKNTTGFTSSSNITDATTGSAVWTLASLTMKAGDLVQAGLIGVNTSAGSYLDVGYSSFAGTISSRLIIARFYLIQDGATVATQDVGYYNESADPSRGIERMIYAPGHVNLLYQNSVKDTNTALNLEVKLVNNTSPLNHRVFVSNSKVFMRNI